MKSPKAWFAAFLDGFTMAGLFTRLRRPGAPTQLFADPKPKIEPVTGKDLVIMLSGPKQRVITTVINKFEAAVGKAGVRLDSPNIFVLVDEGHRTQFGSMHAKMRRALPNACFIAFTGTPVMKRDKSTIEKFGGLIAPSYTIRNAVDDKTVVPLLYEGRPCLAKCFNTYPHPYLAAAAESGAQAVGKSGSR